MLTSQPDTHELVGRVAMVTGSARGQGHAIARRLAAAGASIIAGDVLEDELQKLGAELGEQAICGPLDVGDASSWSSLVDRGVAQFGRLDILANNAGIMHRLSLDEETEDGFTDLWRVNCLGPFLGMKAVLPHMRNSECAAIVNTSSTAGITAWSMHSAYVSSKFAIRGLSRAAALELAPHGIRVNTVFPGPVATPMTMRDDDPQARARLSNVPLGRVGEPEDIAEAVLYLVSDRSAYITGSEITVDGGQTSGMLFTGPRSSNEGGSTPL